MKRLITLTMTIVLVSACATKRYPMLTELSPEQSELMTCRELALEHTEALEVRAQITDTGATDWRSVAAFTADFGIGNAMARSDAEKALNARERSIRTAMVRKECPSSLVPVSHSTEE